MDEPIFPHRKWAVAYTASLLVAVLFMAAFVAYGSLLIGALAGGHHSGFAAATVIFFLAVPFALFLGIWAGAIFLAPPLFLASCLQVGKFGYVVAGVSAGALHVATISLLRAIDVELPMGADVWLIGGALLSEHPTIQELLLLGAFELTAGAAAGTAFGYIFLSQRDSEGS